MFGDVLERDLILTSDYVNFNKGDKCSVCESIEYLHSDGTITICKIVDNKKSKYVWIDLDSLKKITK